MLTGEHRPYDKKVAYVAGGIFDRETIGLNWWATRRWKVGIDYGLIHLDRGGITGTTNAVHMRLQWVY